MEANATSTDQHKKESPFDWKLLIAGVFFLLSAMGCFLLLLVFYRQQITSVIKPMEKRIERTKTYLELFKDIMDVFLKVFSLIEKVPEQKQIEDLVDKI